MPEPHDPMTLREHIGSALVSCRCLPDVLETVADGTAGPRELDSIRAHREFLARDLECIEKALAARFEAGKDGAE